MDDQSDNNVLNGTRSERRSSSERLFAASATATARGACLLRSRHTPCAVAALVLAFASASAETPPPTAADRPPAPIAGTTFETRLSGAGSCSASACHGASITRQQPWRSAFTVWAAEDRHSQAYAVLFEERALRMARLLGLKAPHQERRCLDCHSIQGASESPLAQTALTDGVGCEACHGPARQWLAAHTLKDWNVKTQTLGMNDTLDVATRAKTCVPCHVGAPWRDVNHDLIAAGHPRLAFELLSYQKAMPPHWAAKKDEDPVAVWAIGRLTSLEASLDLLSYRAGLSKATPDGPNTRPTWPEFAEFDCYNCHRPMLRSDTASPSALGLPKRNPWYLAVVDELFKPKGSDTRLAFVWMDPADPWTPLDAAALKPAIGDLATARATLEGWKTKSPPTADLMQRITAQATINDASWDEAAQTYLALVALADRSRPSLRDSRQQDLDEKLAALKEAVQFPVQIGTSGESFHFDSPRNYSPQKFREAMQALVRVLMPSS